MSHFTVLVIGGNVEEQLQPYHEFECTGINDQYIQEIDKTEKLAGEMTGDEPFSLQEALEYHGLEDRVVSDESEVQSAGDDAPHMYGYAVVKDGKLVKAVKRTNPNSKWDWYVIGGRWGDMLKLKKDAIGFTNKRRELELVAGGYADQAVKGNIDVQGMRDAAGRDAAERWDKAAAAAAASGSSWWKSWVQVRAEHGDNLEAARDEYNNQPAIKAMREAAFCRYPLHDYDQYQTPREEFIQAARDGALSAYAVLYNGQWAAKGCMGWFGISDDETNQASWDAKINRLIDELPDDALLTVVDCHI